LMKLTHVDFGTYHAYPVRRLLSSQPCYRFGLNWRHRTLGLVEQNPGMDTTMAQRPRHSTTSSQ
jgi:hypothetical protein